MKSVFALFETFGDLSEAIDDLRVRGFDERGMNVIVGKATADPAAGAPRPVQSTAKTSRVGDRTLQGLGRLLAGEQPVALADVGAVYAAGDLASILIKKVVSPDAVESTLEAALTALHLPMQTVGAYIAGIKRGALLFWIRTGDERSGEAALVLDEKNGLFVTGNLPAAAIR